MTNTRTGNRRQATLCFRNLLRLMVVGIISLSARTPAFADVVNVTYAGLVDFSADPAFPVGSTFTGTFTYRTDLLQDLGGIGFRTFFLDTGALTVTIGGNTYANTNANASFNDFVEVVNFGQFEVAGNAMGGTGPLDGGRAFVVFRGSSDPAFAALQLPFPFPTDFSDTDFIINSVLDVRGTLSDFKAENIASPVPEPRAGLLTLAAVALACLRAKRRRIVSMSVPDQG